MPTLPQDCVNYEINLLMCPCTSDTCGHRGICCECIQASYAAKALPACMNGVSRELDTTELVLRAATECALNRERNQEFCICSSETCDRRGVCCNCVRNHITADGTGRVSCMRGIG